MPWRCPRCNAAIKADSDWCGQCYADLRPPPPPPPVAPPRPPTHHPHAAVVAPGTTEAPGGSMFRPHDPAGSAAEPLWTEEKPPVRPGWPCTECGTLNDFELSACAECGTAFGAALREPRPTLPGDRRLRIAAATAIALLFMAVVALMSTASDVGSDSDPSPAPPVVVEQDGSG